MQYPNEALATAEAAALEMETMELGAESRFDEVFAAAEQAGTTDTVTQTQEFADWMAARADTDAAWGRWAQVRDASVA
jgi:hypothetical protein